MLEVLVNFICALILAILGFYIGRTLIKSKQQLTIKSIIILIIDSLIIAILRYIDNKSPILNYICNIIAYKTVFNISFGKSTLVTGIISLFILLADIFNLFIQFTFIPLYKFQNNIGMYLLSNIIVVIISIILVKIKYISSYLEKIYKILSKNDSKLNIAFIILIVVTASGIIYNLFINYKINYKVITDFIIIMSLLAIAIIFINNKETYNKLSNEYDILLSNVSTFEDWIEKEQFTRHEYKNQLAVLYALSSEKEVKNKIEEIINQNLNIKNEVVNNLKELPKGGLKGLLYYKTIIAEKNKLKITVNVSIKETGILKKINKNNITTLAKIIGIYYDNAIDAAKESRKKNLLLEIYEIKDRVNIVISNTFKKTSIIANMKEKGVSSKGKNHGNGLYYAEKIIKDNKWIEEKHEIIDNYYIETITVKKNTSKK